MDFSRTFTDALCRTWTVTVDFRNDDAFEAVTGTSLVNLIPAARKNGKSNDPGSLDALSEFLADPYRIFDTFCRLVEPQAKAMGLDRAGIKSGFDEDSIAKMGQAVLKAIHDFFHLDPARQAILRQVAKMGRLLTTRLADKAEAEMDKIGIETMLSSISAGVQNESGQPRNSVSGTPATLESIPQVPA